MRRWVFCLALAGGTGCTDPSPGLTVFAASSLTEVFDDIGVLYRSRHPDVGIRFSFAGSQTLRLQIEQGAPASVFASANPEHMNALRKPGRVEDSRLLAENELVVVVPLDNPAGIERYVDLQRASRLVLGSAEVPVGRYARQVLERSGPDFYARVSSRVVSNELNTRLVLAKVAIGEADAAMVYRTDARQSDRVRVIEIPKELSVGAEYRVAVVRPASDAARSFVEIATGPEARSLFEKRGFRIPP